MEDHQRELQEKEEKQEQERDERQAIQKQSEATFYGTLLANLSKKD